MKNSNKTLTAQEIRNLNLNISDVLGYDYQSENGLENNYLTVNGKRVICFVSQNDRRKSFNKIRRMGLGFGWNEPLLTDEEQGIIEASKNGENPFACTIMCADPKQNVVYK